MATSPTTSTSRRPEAPGNGAAASGRQPRNPLDAELRLIRQIESRYHKLTTDAGRAMVVQLLTAAQEAETDG